jgi:hypothetical protein
MVEIYFAFKFWAEVIAGAIGIICALIILGIYIYYTKFYKG